MLNLDFTTFPIIDTDRLHLRRVLLTDSHNIFRFRSNQEAMQYIAKPVAKEISDAENLVKTFDSGLENKTSIAWGITLKPSSCIIGNVGLHNIDKEHYRSEIGYMLHPDYWNKGILTEVLPRIIDYAFNTMGLHSLEAKIDPDNIYSRKLLVNNQFVKEAYFKGNYFFNEQFLDTEVYSLVKS